MLPVGALAPFLRVSFTDPNPSPRCLHTPEGPSAHLLLGDSPSSKLQAVIKLQDREDVQDFRSVLLQAQKALNES